MQRIVPTPATKLRVGDTVIGGGLKRKSVQAVKRQGQIVRVTFRFEPVHEVAADTRFAVLR